MVRVHFLGIPCSHSTSVHGLESYCAEVASIQLFFRNKNILLQLHGLLPAEVHACIVSDRRVAFQPTLINIVLLIWDVDKALMSVKEYAMCIRTGGVSNLTRDQA